MRKVSFITRDDCPLCDTGLRRVERWAGVLGFAVEEIDVDRAGLADRFGEQVPVVLGRGEVVLASGRLEGLFGAMLRERFRQRAGESGNPLR